MRNLENPGTRARWITGYLTDSAYERYHVVISERRWPGSRLVSVRPTHKPLDFPHNSALAPARERASWRRRGIRTPKPRGPSPTVSSPVVSAPVKCGSARLRNEDPGELVVHHLTVRADCEVRCDKTLCARETTFTSGYFPHDRSPLNSVERAQAKDAASDCPERHLTGVSVPDVPRLDKHPFTNDFNL